MAPMSSEIEIQKRHLAKTTRHIVRTQGCIAERQGALAELYQWGLPAGQTEKLLLTMKEALRLMMALKLDIEHQLAAHEDELT